MGRRRVNGIEDDLILLAGLGVGGVLLYNAVFGGGATQDQVDAVNNIYSTPASSNPFSYQFSQSLYTLNGYGSAWWLKLNQEYAAVKQAGGDPLQYGAAYNYITWAEQLRSAFGILYQDTALVTTIFNNMQSQADVSNVACQLWFADTTATGDPVDLYTLLSHGRGIFWAGGLSTKDLGTIVQNVMNLPLH